MEGGSLRFNLSAAEFVPGEYQQGGWDEANEEYEGGYEEGGGEVPVEVGGEGSADGRPLLNINAQEFVPPDPEKRKTELMQEINNMKEQIGRLESLKKDIEKCWGRDLLGLQVPDD